MVQYQSLKHTDTSNPNDLVTLDGPFGDGAATTIRFTAPEFGVAPGQAAVLYAGDRVVGGGWIETTQGA